MRKINLLTKILLLFYLSPLLADQAPDWLDSIKQNQQPLRVQTAHYKAIYWLGKKLFNDKKLSPYIDRSCADCHIPNKIISIVHEIDTPSFYNKHLDESKYGYWNGRITENKYLDSTWLTVEEKIWVPNGIENKTVMQSLIPLVSPGEMFAGGPSDSFPDKSKQQKIYLDVVSGVLQQKEYKKLFAEAFPLPPVSG